jgi:hypothetical protein
MAEASRLITIEEFKEKVIRDLTFILMSPPMTEDLKTCLKSNRDYQDITSITEETLNINPLDIKLVGSVALILQAIFVLETKKEQLGTAFKDLHMLVNQYLQLLDDYDIVVSSSNGNLIIDNYIKLHCKGFIKYKNPDEIPSLDTMEKGIKITYNGPNHQIKIDYIAMMGFNLKRKRLDLPNDGSLFKYTIDTNNIINIAKVNELAQDYAIDHSNDFINNHITKQKNKIKVKIHKFLTDIYSSQSVLNEEPSQKRVKPNASNGSNGLKPVRKLFGGSKRKQTKKKTPKNNIKKTIKKIQKRRKKWACSSCGWSP